MKKHKQEAKVVQLYGGNLNDSEAMMKWRALINSEVRNYIRSGGSLKALAIKSNKCLSTVSNLAYYKTTRPAGTTLVDVAVALGVLEKVGHIFINYKK